MAEPCVLPRSAFRHGQIAVNARRSLPGFVRKAALRLPCRERSRGNSTQRFKLVAECSVCPESDCLPQRKTRVSRTKQPSLNGYDGLQKGAQSALNSAEESYRQALLQLQQAQSRLESTQLMAAELRDINGSLSPADSLFEVSSECSWSSESTNSPSYPRSDASLVSESSYSSPHVSPPVPSTLHQAEEMLQNYLYQEDVQSHLMDYHIDILDCGAQYHVANWLVDVVSDIASSPDVATGKRDSTPALSVPLNLELARRGYDEHAVRFLQHLPYDKVFRIRTIPPSDPHLYEAEEDWMLEVEYDIEEAEFEAVPAFTDTGEVAANTAGVFLSPEICSSDDEVGSIAQGSGVSETSLVLPLQRCLSLVHYYKQTNEVLELDQEPTDHWEENDWMAWRSVDDVEHCDHVTTVDLLPGTTHPNTFSMPVMPVISQHGPSSPVALLPAPRQNLLLTDKSTRKLDGVASAGGGSVEMLQLTVPEVAPAVKHPSFPHLGIDYHGVDSDSEDEELMGDPRGDTFHAQREPVNWSLAEVALVVSVAICQAVTCDVSTLAQDVYLLAIGCGFAVLSALVVGLLPHGHGGSNRHEHHQLPSHHACMHFSWPSVELWRGAVLGREEEEEAPSGICCSVWCYLRHAWHALVGDSEASLPAGKGMEERAQDARSRRDSWGSVLEAMGVATVFLSLSTCIALILKASLSLFISTPSFLRLTLTSLQQVALNQAVVPSHPTALALGSSPSAWLIPCIASLFVAGGYACRKLMPQVRQLQWLALGYPQSANSS